MIAFHPAALAEIERARDWYEDKRPGLGGDLVDEVGHALVRIESAPASFAHTPGDRATRRALLTRFPYWLVFTVLENDDVLVVALAHARRRASYWRRRVGSKR